MRLSPPSARSKESVSSNGVSRDRGALQGFGDSLHSCGLLPACRAPLLAGLHDFAHVACRPNLKNIAVFDGRMLRHELYSMIHVPRFQDENAAELFLGFRVG